jgi:hypothetical protein
VSDTASYSYVVEPGIPIPPPNRKGNTKSGRPIYPFKLMAVGDSFFVPAGSIGTDIWIRINAAINTRQQKADVRYCWRRMTNADGVDGFRVWRTK